MAEQKEDRLSFYRNSTGNSKKIEDLTDEELIRASLDVQRKFYYYQRTCWDLDSLDLNIRFEAEKREIDLECMDKYAKTKEEKAFYTNTFKKRFRD